MSAEGGKKEGEKIKSREGRKPQELDRAGLGCRTFLEHYFASRQCSAANSGKQAARSTKQWCAAQCAGGRAEACLTLRMRKRGAGIFLYLLPGRFALLCSNRYMVSSVTRQPPSIATAKKELDHTITARWIRAPACTGTFQTQGGAVGAGWRNVSCGEMRRIFHPILPDRKNLFFCILFDQRLSFGLCYLRSA